MAKVNSKHFFCPFQLSREYLALRGNYRKDTDQFFIFKDQAPVTPTHVRKILNQVLTAVNLSPDLYGTHSFRVGRATDMIKFGYRIEEVKIAGRWHSNVVYKYIQSY